MCPRYEQERAVEQTPAMYVHLQVKSESTPEWRKILLRYTDWVSLIVLASAIISATVPNEGSRGWTSFVLLIIHLNIIVWSGWIADRNAGNAMSELKVGKQYCEGCKSLTRYGVPHSAHILAAAN